MKLGAEPSSIPLYSPDCVEGVSLLKKSLSDQSKDQNGVRTLPKRGSNAAKAGRVPLEGISEGDTEEFFNRLVNSAKLGDVLGPEGDLRLPRGYVCH